jgi:hypothetical protein
MTDAHLAELGKSVLMDIADDDGQHPMARVKAAQILVALASKTPPKHEAEEIPDFSTKTDAELEAIVAGDGEKVQ